MANTSKTGTVKLTKVPYDRTKRDVHGRVIGNPYQYKSGKTMYQAVPESMVTLPKQNAFIIQKKHVYLDKEKKNQATYILGYSNLKGKTRSDKTRRHYFVARQIWRGGNPALVLYRYSGYDLGLAKQVFAEIAYDKAEYMNKDGKFVPYRKSSMSSEEIVKSKIRKQKALEAMKTKAYGNKKERQAWAESKGYMKK